MDGLGEELDLGSRVLSGVAPWCGEPLWSMVRLLALLPMWVLYHRGPRLFGRLFYAGRAPADMCAEINTGAGSDFWRAHPDQCDEIIRRDFDSFTVAMGFGFYVYVMLSVGASLLAAAVRWLLSQQGLVARRRFRLGDRAVLGGGDSPPATSDRDSRRRAAYAAYDPRPPPPQEDDDDATDFVGGHEAGSTSAATMTLSE